MFNDITSSSFQNPAHASLATASVIVITGASSGIGRATALAFAHQGASLVLASRNREALEAVATECNDAGGRAIVVPTDVTDAGAVQALADAALERFGHIDVWINNVGVGAVGLFDATPLEAHRRVIESNLMGHMHGAYAVIPHFRARGRGTLINMISLGGWVSAPYAAAYTASKFGLRGFPSRCVPSCRACRMCMCARCIRPSSTHRACRTGPTTRVTGSRRHHR